jgi:LysM repeat protein
MAKVALSFGHDENTYETGGGKGVKVNGKVYEEYHFNKAVGEKVNAILKAHGVTTLVVTGSLSNRTSKANSWDADIYWSIHANAGASSARGLAGFYYEGSKTGLKLAQLYAKYCKAENFPVYSGDYIYESQRGTWSDFHELRQTAMPALLTENGFMTNPEDFKLIFLNQGNFHNRLAYAHSKAILEYFGIKYDAYKSGEKKKPAPTPVKPAPAPTAGTHKVVSGDTLWGISMKYDLSVAELKQLNGMKTDVIHVGDVLKVGKVTTHKVVSGDTLWGLSRKYNTTVASIKSLNGLKSDVLTIGDTLRVK